MVLESAARVLRGMLEGWIDPLEHAESVLARIREWEPRVHAYLSLRTGEVISIAEDAARRIRSGRARRLEGLIVAVKDNIFTSSMPTTAASRFLEGFTPGYSATVVERLEREGAIIVGKTNMDEFGMGSTTENSAFGPTRNPIDTDRVPGGSSGGSAAALAYGGADLALGSDTGGSVRLPAAYTGIVGLKPTYGAVSRYGLVPYANSLEQIGPMGRSVMDVALLYSVIAGHDPRDATSLPGYTPPEPDRLGPADPRSVRICVVQELVEGAHSGVRDVITRLLRELEEAGARVEEASIPELRGALASYYTIATAEAASNLARYDGSIYRCRLSPPPRNWEDLVVRSRTECFGSEVKRRILMGVYALSTGYREMAYLAATGLRRRIRDAVRRLTGRCVLASPTSPEPPPLLGEKLVDPASMYLLDLDTVTANLAGVPALTQPAGTYGGLPVGIQWMGPPKGEEELFRLGLLVEVLKGWSR